MLEHRFPRTQLRGAGTRLAISGDVPGPFDNHSIRVAPNGGQAGLQDSLTRRLLRYALIAIIAIGAVYGWVWYSERADPDAGISGAQQTLTEGTITVGWRPVGGDIVKAEGRYDHSTAPVFADRGRRSTGEPNSTDSQILAVLGTVISF